MQRKQFSFNRNRPQRQNGDRQNGDGQQQQPQRRMQTFGPDRFEDDKQEVRPEIIKFKTHSTYLLEISKYYPIALNPSGVGYHLYGGVLHPHCARNPVMCVAPMGNSWPLEGVLLSPNGDVVSYSDNVKVQPLIVKTSQGKAVYVTLSTTMADGELSAFMAMINTKLGNPQVAEVANPVAAAASLASRYGSEPNGIQSRGLPHQPYGGGYIPGGRYQEERTYERGREPLEGTAHMRTTSPKYREPLQMSILESALPPIDERTPVRPTSATTLTTRPPSSSPLQTFANVQSVPAAAPFIPLGKMDFDAIGVGAQPTAAQAH